MLGYWAYPLLPRFGAFGRLPAFGALPSQHSLTALSGLLPALPWPSGPPYRLSSSLSFRLASRALWPSAPLFCLYSFLSFRLASMAFRDSLLPVFFHDFDYFTNANGYNFTVVVLRKSKLADKINYAASSLNFQHALNCSSSKLRCQLNVETC